MTPHPLLPLLLACRIVTDAEKITHDDPDGDGFSIDEDCGEYDAAISPGVTEIPYNGVDDDCKPGSPDDDLDEDEYPLASDCDDARSDIFPDALEVCDGKDNDCDGETDEDGGEGVNTWYADADGDQHGDAESTLQTCGEGPDDYVGSSDDCDDRDDTVSPSATEICDGKDNDCDGETDEDAADARTWYLDEDQDSFGQDASTTAVCEAPERYVAEGGDCDDNDASVFPDAEESCDGVDEDCDGSTDEAASDASAWYADIDGDTFGDLAEQEIACEIPPGFVGAPGDCDDGDVALNPDADELCDLVDNDCDGEIDEATAIDAGDWYADIDGDSFGDVGTATTSCEAPTGHVSSATDCDDTDPEVNPDAEEIPGDAIDQDCDGAEQCFIDDDGDGEARDNGELVDSTDLDCDDARERDEAGEDCDDDDETVFVGALPVCDDGRANDCEGDDDDERLFCRAKAPETLWTLSEPDAYAFVGSTLTSMSDLDGDTFDELVVGAYYASSGDIRPGAVWLVGGGLESTEETLQLSTVAATTLEGDADGEVFGWALTAVDLDADGSEELVVGAPKASVSGLTASGELVVLAGTDLADALEDPGDVTPITSWHAGAGDGGGYSLAAAMDEDVGDAWLLVGVPYSDGAAPNSGDARLLRIDADGDLATELTLTGEDSKGYAGKTVAVGDLGGEGETTLVVAAPSGSTTPYAKIFAMSGPTGDTLLSEADWSWTSDSLGDHAGIALSLCDLDNSGTNDLVIGAPNTGKGAAWLAFNPAEAHAALSELQSIQGLAAEDQLGGAVACADLDGDEIDDLVLGAQYADVGFDKNAGEVYIFYGPITAASSSPDSTASGTHWDQNLGSSLAIVADQEGDGRSELLAGATGAATDLSGEVVFDAGAVLLLSVQVE